MIKNNDFKLCPFPPVTVFRYLKLITTEHKFKNYYSKPFNNKQQNLLIGLLTSDSETIKVFLIYMYYYYYYYFFLYIYFLFYFFFFDFLFFIIMVISDIKLNYDVLCVTVKTPSIAFLYQINDT